MYRFSVEFHFSVFISLVLILLARVCHLKWVNENWTISNCFKKCGFPIPPNEGNDVPQDIEFHDESRWNEVCAALNVTATFEEYVGIDENVHTVGCLSDDEIIREVLVEDTSDDDGESNDVPNEPLINRSDALQHLRDLQVYFESVDVPPETFGMLNTLQRIVEYRNNTIQKKLTSYFLPTEKTNIL